MKTAAEFRCSFAGGTVRRGPGARLRSKNIAADETTENTSRPRRNRRSRTRTHHRHSLHVRAGGYIPVVRSETAAARSENHEVKYDAHLHGSSVATRPASAVQNRREIFLRLRSPGPSYKTKYRPSSVSAVRPSE